MENNLEFRIQFPNRPQHHYSEKMYRAYQNKDTAWFNKPANKSKTNKATGTLKLNRYLGAEQTAE